jgi:hypothetical protein
MHAGATPLVEFSMIARRFGLSSMVVDEWFARLGCGVQAQHLVVERLIRSDRSRRFDEPVETREVLAT